MSDTGKKISNTLIIPPPCRERFIPLHGSLGEGLRRHGVQLAGVSALCPPYEVGRTCPPFHLLLYTIRGQAKLATDQGERILHPGQLFIVPSQVACAYWPIGAWECCWVHLEDNDEWALLRGSDAQVLMARELPQVHRVMEGLIAEALSAMSVSNSATDLYADLLLVYLKRECASAGLSTEAGDGRRLRPIWEAVNAHLAYPWNVEALASRAACSPAHFFRLTKQYHRMTPMQMVTYLRLSRVKELLLCTDYSLEQIATMVGYANPYVLSRVFRRTIGISPGAYRLQQHRR